jgi:uncharacterized repeat protein (TIGR01451 family)/LPXTG-motif cell wall-anchored protein
MKLKLRLNKLVSFVASLSLLANSLLTPFSIAYAQDATPTPEPTPIVEETLTPEPTETPTITPAPEETLMPTPTPEGTVAPIFEITPSPVAEPSATPNTSPEPAPEPNPTPTLNVEKVCLTDEGVVDSKNEDWRVDGDKAETKEPVKLGVKYNFPQENRVSVTFKCLPKDESLRTTLKIQKVKVSDLKLPEGVNPYGEYAYDITTGMNDGDFEYDITLPKLENSTAEVSYIEKSIEEVKATAVKTDEVKQIGENQIGQEGDQVKASGIDHFTIYIATYADIGLNTNEAVYLRGDTVYFETTNLLESNNYHRVDIVEQDGTTRHNVIACTKGVTYLSGSYILSLSAPTGDDWKVQIKEYANLNNCSNRSDSTESGNKYFEVKVTNPVLLANPTISQSCGLDIALVIDTSSSIDSTELGQMKTALTGFVTALTGTPTQFSVTKFGTNANKLLDFTSDSTLVNNTINAIPVSPYGTQGTNWKEGIIAARGTFDPRTSKPNLMIFASDGNPTFPNCGGGSTCSDDVNAAVTEANIAKSSPLNIRILALGIGDGLLVENLKAISGHVVNASSLIDSDVVTTDFSGMAAQLASFAKQTCGGRISINKYVDSIQTGGGQTWSFKIDGTTTLTTDSNGQVASGILSVGNHSVSEVSIPTGYTYNHATCTSGVADPTNPGVKDISVSADSIITCNFYNTSNYTPTRICHADGNSGNYSEITPDTLGVLMGHVGAGHQNGNDIIPIIPVFLPSGQNWDTTGQAIWNNHCVLPPAKGTLIIKKTLVNNNGGTKSYSDFSFSVNGAPTVAFEPDGQNDLSVDSGTYNITESIVTGYTTTYNGCSGIVLAAGGSATCTITNTRNTGELRVQKIVDFGSVRDWWFSLDGGTAIQSDVNGVVNFGQVTTLDNHTITETGSSMSSFTTEITGENCLTSPIGSGIATATVFNGGTTTCVFSNSVNKGSITITKDAVPDNAQDFSFVTSGSGLSGFTLDDDGDNGNVLSNTQAFSNLLPGAYTISETLTAGWQQPLVSCRSDKQSNNNFLGTDLAAINLSAGENVTCTFVNNKIPRYDGLSSCPADKSVKTLRGTHLISSRDVDGEVLSEVVGGNGYLFEVSGTFLPTSAQGYLSDAAHTLVNGTLSGLYGINGTPPDFGAHALLADLGGGIGIVNWGSYNPLHTYSIYYTPPNSSPQFVIGDRWDSWYSTSFNNQSGMNDNSGDLTLDVYECQSTGSITITKDVVPDDSSVWDFIISGFGGTYTFNNLGDGQSHTFTNLTPGSWNITEITDPNYTTTVTCGGIGPLNQNGFLGTVVPGQDLSCIFINTRNTGTLQVLKNVDLSGDGDYGETGETGVANWQWQAIGPATENGYTGDTAVTVPSGGYILTETPQTDFHFHDLNCTGGNLDKATNTVTVVKGANVICTFENLIDTGSITAHKFADFDKSGTQDAGEPDVNYIQMSLYQGSNCSGSLISQLDTQGSGNAVFGNLTVGDYSVRETLPPPGLPGMGWWINISPLCQNVHVTYDHNQQVNFANFKVQELTVCKSNDMNGDGQWQPGDNRLAGWTINLTGPENLSGVTGGDGCVRIPINIYGGYVVTEVLQPGWIQTFPSSPQTGYAFYNLSSGLQIYNFQLGTISGQKFNDLNGNGIKETDEPVLPNWTINLDKNADGSVDATTVTNTDGIYTFSGLTAGTYRVRETGQGGWTQTTQNPADIVITSGSDITGKDFGNVQLSDIHGYKWSDLNVNGEQDGDEVKLGGWRIFIDADGDRTYDDGETFTFTDSGEELGWYWFMGVLPGTYSICEELKSGWNQTYPSSICHTINLPYVSGLSMEANFVIAPVYNFGNQEELPGISIVKSNDKSGGVGQNDTIIYTLTLKNTGNMYLNNIIVKDVPAGGFTYISGSTNITGDYTSTVDPTISDGQLSWAIPGISVGGEIVISYKVLTPSDLTFGTYTNYATCNAQLRKVERFLIKLSLFTDSIEEDGNGVEVNCDPTSSTVSRGVSTSYGGGLSPQVLGASTELPATGNSTWVLILAGLAGIFGVALRIYGKKRYAKN